MLRIVGVAIGVIVVAGGYLAAQQTLPAPHNYPPGVVDVTPPPSHSDQAHVENAACYAEPLPTFLVSVEYLLVRPRRSDLDYAAVDPRNNLIPEGRTASLDWGTQSGIRLGFLWRPQGGLNDVSFTYTYAYSNDSENVTAPTGGVLFPLLTRPGRIDEATTASASSSINYNVFDLDLGRQIIAEECFQTRIFAGARIADIGQVLEASYNGLDANQAMARHRTQMEAGGLTAGGEARWVFGRGLSAYGRGRGSLVVADYQVCARETDFASNVVITDINDSFTKVVPVLDLAMGLSWKRRNMRASLGYEISHWFNQAESITFLDDFAEGKRIRRAMDLSLEALTFQLGWEF